MVFGSVKTLRYSKNSVSSFDKLSGPLEKYVLAPTVNCGRVELAKVKNINSTSLKSREVLAERLSIC
jgi:hypothetical protein